MKINIAFFFVIHFSSIMYGCCSTKKKIQQPTAVLAIHPLNDFKTFKATKALLSLMQRNLADHKDGRKIGIHVDFGDYATVQGIVVYYYGSPKRVPNFLCTPWGRFFQDQYTHIHDMSGVTFQQTRLPKWNPGAGGDYYTVTQVNSIRLPTSKKLQNVSKENSKIMYQNAWEQLEERFGAEEHKRQ